MPYAHLISAMLISGEDSETLRLAFSAHDVEIVGRNLRSLLLALQDFAVKWVRAIPERYQLLEAKENDVVLSIRIREMDSNTE